MEEKKKIRKPFLSFAAHDPNNGIYGIGKVVSNAGGYKKIEELFWVDVEELYYLIVIWTGDKVEMVTCIYENIGDYLKLGNKLKFLDVDVNENNLQNFLFDSDDYLECVNSTENDILPFLDKKFISEWAFEGNDSEKDIGKILEIIREWKENSINSIKKEDIQKLIISDE